MARPSHKILINADIGEDPSRKGRDLSLLPYLDQINIAVGGHAGDKNSADYWYKQGRQLGLVPTLHLSYPDWENFGRGCLDLPWSELKEALTRQRGVLPEVRHAKFHGQLYHDVSDDQDLAQKIEAWAIEMGIRILTHQSRHHFQSLLVQREGFIDRRYYQDQFFKLNLLPRSDPRAVISDPSEARRQYDLLGKGFVYTVNTPVLPIEIETACVHSDNPQSLEIASSLERS